MRNKLLLTFGLLFAFTLNSLSQNWLINGNTDADTAKLRIGNRGFYDFQFITNDLTRMRLTKSGFLGIGTNNPTQQLDVFGQIRLRTGANNYFVLTSDANGTGTWTQLNLNLTGTSLSLTNHGTSVNLGGLFTAGTGLTLTGTTFSHTAHTGDVTGASVLTVARIQSRNVSSTAPTNGQVLKWNNTASQWEPSTDNNTSYTASTGLSLAGTIFSAQTTSALWNANQLQSISLSSTAPNSGQVLKYNGTSWAPAVDNNTTYTAGFGIDITGTTISNTGDIDNTNEIQSLSLSNNSLAISSSNSVDLSPYLDNTDAQSLSVNSNQLSITNGNSVSLPVYNAGSGINVSGTYPNFSISNTLPDQTVSIISGNGISATGTYPNFTITNTLPDQTVNLTHGGATSISGTYPNFTISSTDNDQQTLTFNNNRLEISGGNLVDLSSLLDNTDEQILSLSGQNLSISNGNTVDLTTINTDNQNLTLTGNTLNITNGTGVSLPEYAAGNGIVVTNNIISAIDDSQTNEIQQLEINGHTLTLSNGGGTITIPDENTIYTAGNGIQINNNTISAFDDSPTNEIQQLTINGHTLSLTNGGTVTIPDENTTYTAGTGLSITGNTINSVWTKTGNDIFNNNSQNVGVGINTPQSKLHIHDKKKIINHDSELLLGGDDKGIPNMAEPTICKIQLTNTNTGSTSTDGLLLGVVGNSSFLNLQENGSFSLQTNNLTRMVVTSEGKLGIATTNPSEQFQIGDRWTFHNGGSKVIGYNFKFSGGSDRRIVSDAVATMRFESGNIHFKMAPTGTTNSIITNYTTSLFLKNNGKVGVGTNDPNEQLDINGAVKIGNTSLSVNGSIKFDGTDFLGCTNGQWVPFSGLWKKNEVGDVYRNTGFVGIGLSNPTSALTIQGNNDVTSSIVINNTNSGGTFSTSQFILRAANGVGRILSDADVAVFLDIHNSKPNESFKILTHNDHWDDQGILRQLFSVDNNGADLRGSFRLREISSGQINTFIADNGHITCRKVIVKVTGNIGDFVFNPEYQIPTLYEEENYYLKHKHLKGIPSAKEVIDNGMDLDSFVSSLLQKLETTTIQNVNQQKEIDLLKEQINLLLQEVNKLKK